MTNGNISPLRRRMAGDMTIRGFTPSTQRGYLAAVENFTGQEAKKRVSESLGA